MLVKAELCWFGVADYALCICPSARRAEVSCSEPGEDQAGEAKKKGGEAVPLVVMAVLRVGWQLVARQPRRQRIGRQRPIDNRQGDKRYTDNGGEGDKRASKKSGRSDDHRLHPANNHPKSPLTL